MEHFIRENSVIYIGGDKSDYDKLGCVNISHLGFGMSQREHMYAIAYCFGITFILFKGSNAFQVIYPKFIEWQEKLYGCNKSESKECYKTLYDAAKTDMENLTISMAVNYVSAEDIRNYISKEKEKSYNEGYAEHKRQLREVFGLK